MSIRTEINKKKRTLDIVAVSGFAVFGIGLVSMERARYLSTIAVIGFLIFFGAILYSFYGIKCLKCKGQFGYIVMSMGTLFSVSKKIKYCPFCGVDIDTELKNNSNGV